MHDAVHPPRGKKHDPRADSGRGPCHGVLLPAERGRHAGEACRWSREPACRRRCTHPAAVLAPRPQGAQRATVASSARRHACAQFPGTRVTEGCAQVPLRGSGLRMMSEGTAEDATVVSGMIEKLEKEFSPVSVR